MSVQGGITGSNIASGTLELIAGSGYIGGQFIIGVGTPGLDAHAVLEYSHLLVSGTRGSGNGVENNSCSLGLIASVQALDILSTFLDEASYQDAIDLAYESAAATVGEGQVLAWSGDLGYYAADADSFSYDWWY